MLEVQRKMDLTDCRVEVMRNKAITLCSYQKVSGMLFHKGIEVHHTMLHLATCLKRS